MASTKSEITTKTVSAEAGPEGDMSRKEAKVDPKKVPAIDKDLLQVFSISLTFPLPQIFPIQVCNAFSSLINASLVCNRLSGFLTGIELAMLG